MNEKNKALRILVLEPYYGGSHKTFLDELKQAISSKRKLSKEHVFALTERFSWDKLVPEYRRWISNGSNQ